MADQQLHLLPRAHKERSHDCRWQNASMALSLRMTRGSGDAHNHALISVGMLFADLADAVDLFDTLALSPSRFPEAFQQQI